MTCLYYLCIILFYLWDFFMAKFDNGRVSFNNIKYQCIIFIQFYATESDITVVVFWLIIQIMYSPVKRGFSFLKMRQRYHPDHMHTMYPSTAWNKHFLHAMYFRCYNNWLKKMTIIKLFYFLSPNVILLFVFKIASWNIFFFLRNSVLCIFKLFKLNFFWQTNGIYYSN